MTASPSSSASNLTPRVLVACAFLLCVRAFGLGSSDSPAVSNVTPETVESETACRCDEPLLLAQGLIDAGNWDEAITEYERFIFFASDSEEQSRAWVSISRCRRGLSQWDASIDALRRASGLTADDSLRSEYRLEIGITSLAARRYSAAEIELLRVATFGRQPALKRRASLFLGICDVYAGKFAEARRAFAVALDSADSRRRVVDSLLMNGRCAPYLSPSRAKWLSTFLPGAGQFYAGDIKNGFNALLLNGVTGYLLVDRVLAGDWVTVLLSGVGLFQRYYFGQRLRSEEIASRQNELATRRLAARVIEAVRGTE